MTTQEKIEQLLQEENVANNYLPFKVSVRLKSTTRATSHNLIMPNVMDNLSKKEVSDFLNKFKPHKELRISTKHGKDVYEFVYKIDVSSSPNNRYNVTIEYIDELENEIYLGIPYEWIQDFLVEYKSEVNETELHYFGGIDRNKIGSIRRMKFKGKSIAWYEGHHTLICENTTNEIIKLLTTND